jgi:hypothetical protein
VRDILTRLELLEANKRQDPLILLCEDDNGNAARMTVTEMLNAGRGFVRVVGGSSLKDLDMLLAAFHERALQAAERPESEV